MKHLATLTALALVAGFGSAHAASVDYAIDSSHTFAYFSYDHLGLTYQTHGFKKVSGKLGLDRENSSGRGEVTIDVKSLDTGVPKFTEALLGPDFFDAAKFPTMTFKANQFNYVGSSLQTVGGVLTVRGIDKPVIFAVSNFVCKQHPMLKKEACGANLISQISRTAYKMGKFAPGVADEVTLNVMVEAIKE